jgi:hypothetical protein
MTGSKGVGDSRVESQMMFRYLTEEEESVSFTQRATGAKALR